MGSEIPHFTNERLTVSFTRREVSCHAVPTHFVKSTRRSPAITFPDKCSVASLSIFFLNSARCAWRYKPQCHLALLRQNGLYPLCCLSSMHIIDKKSIAWLTKHLWLLPHISMPGDHNFLVAPRVLLELDHDSWIILPLFSVWNSLSFALKDQQGFKARLTIGKCGQLHGTPCLIMAFTCRSSPY